MIMMECGRNDHIAGVRLGRFSRVFERLIPRSKLSRFATSRGYMNYFISACMGL